MDNVLVVNRKTPDSPIAIIYFFTVSIADDLEDQLSGLEKIRMKRSIQNLQRGFAEALQQHKEYFLTGHHRSKRGLSNYIDTPYYGKWCGLHNTGVNSGGACSCSNQGRCG